MNAFDSGFELEAAASGRGTSIVALLLSARASEASAGNRRRLYVVFDELLEGDPDHHVVELGATMADRPANDAAITLHGLKLTNWKSFERADLRLRTGNGRGLMTVVNGQNGFGKSSILEAIAFGLFGRQAVSELGFLLNSTGGRGGQRRSYHALVEQSLHRSERARREATAGVGLIFEGGDGPIEIERRWYFDDDGRLIEEDEELLIRVGEDRNLLETPLGHDPREWYQQEIERRVMPADLAPFFLFDGEQVDRWAERKLSDQVRLAISRALGLSDLTSLAEDLRDYARDRERRYAGSASGTIEDLLAEVEALEAELASCVHKRKEVDAELAIARGERDDALSSLAADPGSSHADLQHLLEDEHRLLADRGRVERELVGTIADVGPLLMASGGLLRSLTQTLTSEAADERAGGLDPVDFEAFWHRVLVTEPMLEEATAGDLRGRLLHAWSSGDADASAQRTHGHLDRGLREAVLTRLRNAPKDARSRLAKALESLQEARLRLQDATTLRTSSADKAEEQESARTRLAALAPRLEELERDGLLLDHRTRQIEEGLSGTRVRLDGRLDEVRKSEPRLRAAQNARLLAGRLHEDLRKATIDEHGSFAEAVTESFRALAHKGQISRIAITADGDVELFDAQGRDITDYRLSAGENQLFAMALIAAVGTRVGRRLPLFVDTPLGRLDTRHRGSVLRMLTQREGQTVLLTQPEELTPRHLEALRPVLAGVVELSHSLDARSGVGVSSFDEVSA